MFNNLQKVILGTTMLSSFALASLNPSNIVTYIETNSPLSIQNESLIQIDDQEKSINDLFNGNKFGSYSPYFFKDVTNNSDIASPTVIVIVGEKSINVGSFFSKSYLNKSNINNFFYTAMAGTGDQDISLNSNKIKILINSLNEIDENNSIYSKTKDVNSEYYHEVILNLRNHIDSEVSLNKLDNTSAKRLRAKITFVENILNYGDKIFQNISSHLPNLKIIRNPAINPLSKLGQEGYSINGSNLKRECKFYFDDMVFDLNIEKPIEASALWDFLNYPCFAASDAEDMSKKFWKKFIKRLDMPSTSEKREEIGNAIRIDNMKGHARSALINFYRSISQDQDIKNNLDYFSRYGITNGKIINVTYGFDNVMSGNSVRMGMVKNVGVGTVFNKQINLNSYNFYPFTLPNYVLPNLIVDGDKDDNVKREYVTVVKQELLKVATTSQEDIPLIPNEVKSNQFSSSTSGLIRGMIVDGVNEPDLFMESGSPLYWDGDQEYTSKMIEIDSMDQVSNVLKNKYTQDSKQLFPIAIKNINSINIPLNIDYNTSMPKSLKYFGPMYKIIIHEDKIITEEFPNELPVYKCAIEFKPLSPNKNYKFLTISEMGEFKMDKSDADFLPTKDKYSYSVNNHDSPLGIEHFYFDTELNSNVPCDITEETEGLVNTPQKLLTELAENYAGEESYYDAKGNDVNYYDNGSWISNVVLDENIFAEDETSYSAGEMIKDLDQTQGAMQKALLSEVRGFITNKYKLAKDVSKVSQLFILRVIPPEVPEEPVLPAGAVPVAPVVPAEPVEPLPPVYETYEGKPGIIKKKLGNSEAGVYFGFPKFSLN